MGRCPVCSKENPAGTMRCGCGYSYLTGEIVPPPGPDGEAARPAVAAVVAYAVSSRYSPKLAFERDADAAVAGYLRDRKIPLGRYADILGRLQEELDRKVPGEPAPARNYLSTHPPTAERIKAFRGK